MSATNTVTHRPFTIPDLAERWKCSAVTVRRLIKAGTLRAGRLTPGAVRVSWEEVQRYEASKLESPGSKRRKTNRERRSEATR